MSIRIAFVSCPKAPNVRNSKRDSMELFEEWEAQA